jgi:hypothetical protein
MEDAVIMLAAILVERLEPKPRGSRLTDEKRTAILRLGWNERRSANSSIIPT